MRNKVDGSVPSPKERKLKRLDILHFAILIGMIAQTSVVVWLSRRWMMILTGVLILLSLTTINPVRGGAMEVVVGANSLTVHMNIVLQENSTSLPLVNFYLSSSNSTDVSGHFAPAVQKLVPGASISSLTLHAQTLNSSGTWFLRENYTLVLEGVSRNYGSSIKANLGFVSMDVPDSMISGGLELNTVGSAYLVKPLNSQGNQSTLYYVNGHQSLTSVIPVQTTVLFHLLDFSWLPSVSSWQVEKDWLGQSTSLTFDLGGPRFNLTFGPRSHENTLLKAFTAVYDPSLTIITVPAVAWLDGTYVSFDVSTPADFWMPVISGVPVIIFISTLFLDRRLTKSQRVIKKNVKSKK